MSSIRGIEHTDLNWLQYKGIEGRIMHDVGLLQQYQRLPFQRE